jgi:PAS domain S-box-containing protein
VQSVLLAGGAFAFDWMVPAGVAGGVPYVIVILVALNRAGRRHTKVVALACAALTIIGFFLASEGYRGDVGGALTNRFLALFVIWVTTALGLQLKRTEEALRKSQHELEQRVEERTAELAQMNEELRTEITDRERAEEASRSLEDRTETILDHAPDAVIACDADGAIVSWNPQAEAIFGWTRLDALGKLLGEMIVPPDRREAFRNGMTSFLTTGQWDLLNRRFEATALHHNGHEIPVEVTISPVPWGGTYLFSAFVRDLTEPMKISQEVQATQSFAESVIETVRDPLLVLDGDLQVRSANRPFCETFQLPPEELHDRLIYDLADGGWDIPPLRSLLEEALAEQHEVRDVELEHEFPSLGRRKMLLNIQVVRDSGGSERPERIVLVFQDVHPPS